MKLDIKL